ncbi:hypothetical protein [Alteribacillus sp. YIM 98480]|nr:hypothetical protein [Alteribacillus sp. YIM 98480]
MGREVPESRLEALNAKGEELNEEEELEQKGEELNTKRSAGI